MPVLPLEQVVSKKLTAATPLLKEERDTGRKGGIPDGQHPGKLHRTGFGAGFAADDDPIKPGKVKARQGTEQRLQRDKLDGSVGRPKNIRTSGIGIIWTQQNQDRANRKPRLVATRGWW